MSEMCYKRFEHATLDDVLATSPELKGAQVMPAKDSTFVSTKEAADLARRTPEAIRKWKVRGWLSLAGQSHGRGQVGDLFVRRDVEKLIARLESDRIRLETVKPLSEPDKAYLAGLIDGEGCFSGARRKRTDSQNPKTEQYAYRLAVNMTVKEPLHWAYEVTGLGRIYNYPQTRGKGLYQPIWAWHVYGRQAGVLAEAILPYLKVKREHALIVIAVNELRFIADPSVRVPQVSELISKLRYLNRRAPQIARDAGLLFL